MTTEQNDHLAILNMVARAVEDGILTPTHKPMNGHGTDYVSVGTGDGIRPEDVRIGTLTRDQYGEPARVYVDVRIAHVQQGHESETTDHRKITDYWELSISAGITTASGRRQDDYDSCGQSRESVAMANGAPASLPKFVKVWDEYHLTGMNAACDHQAVVYEDGPYGRRPSLTATLPCLDDEGNVRYRYGHAWLVKDLPASAVETVLIFLRAAHEQNVQRVNMTAAKARVRHGYDLPGRRG